MSCKVRVTFTSRGGMFEENTRHISKKKNFIQRVVLKGIESLDVKTEKQMTTSLEGH